MTSYNEFDSIWAPPDKAVDDKGGVHERVQDAVDNSESLVLIGPGTFEEDVVVDSPGTTIMGVGRPSHILGSSIAIDIQSPSTNLVSLSTETTGGENVSVGADSFTADGCYFRGASDADADLIFLTSNGSSHTISNSVFESSPDGGVAASTDGVIISNNRFEAGIGGDAIGMSRGPALLGLNYIESAGNNGIVFDTPDIFMGLNTVRNVGANGIISTSDASGCLVLANRVVGSGSDGIVGQGIDNSYIANYVTGSTDSDIDISGEDSPLARANVPTTANSISGSEIENGTVTGSELGRDAFTRQITVPLTEIPDGDSAVGGQIFVPSDRSIYITEAGSQDSGGSPWPSLEIVIEDIENSTELYRGDGVFNEGDPLAQKTGSFDAQIRVENNTGGTLNASGFAFFTLE